jgi:IS6 family transposase
MSDFKGRHFEGELVLWAVRWYCRYGVSYRDLEQMMGERGVSVDHSTIYRWVQKYGKRCGADIWRFVSEL